ncbi:RNA polymerase II transcriptional coactivator KELP [Penicillium argentinense]|uniref:RNA polymerase II transcriptional coactivator KELP n=1 Tax=Penicillium argentinense TaxID=1131581 RepID=A0A9W9FMC5_9EURO|nr:RNA polymerase II transcriptional coactivator KELP [Penicillium argentinense]KAJ5102879.1 RNA polymerase II transcriptional coactivator KELP [Penicillium argentinense]
MTSRKRSSGLQGADDAQAKKAKVGSDGPTTAKTDSNGDRYWEISKMRRVTISTFHEKTMINVREYYEKNGEQLPGKKGISMPIDQFAALVELLPELEQALQQHGEALPRPTYSGAAGQVSGGNDEHDQSSKSPSKQNIEATSDEESEA